MNVADDDMATEALAAVVVAIRRLAAAGTQPTMQDMLNELRRVGTLQHFACKVLTDAWIGAASPMSLRESAAAVVSDSLRRRRRAESAGMTMSVADCERRLDQLRDRS